MTNARRWGAMALWSVALALLLGPLQAAAQSVPVRVSVTDNIAVAVIGNPANPIADVTLEFEQVSGLSVANLGLSAMLVDLDSPSLRARMPSPALVQPASAFPLLLTIEPPADGGLTFRAVRVEVHTHALPYTVGSSLRLFKAPTGGGVFQDITTSVKSGSVRSRGYSGGFSQFMVLQDLRESDVVVTTKIAALDARIQSLSATERPAFTALLDQVEAGVASADYAVALSAVQGIANRALARAGTQLPDRWRASRNADNQAGDLISAADSVRFSIEYLRDFGN